MSVKSDVSRREFLARLGAAGALFGGVGNIVHAQAPRPATGVRVGVTQRTVVQAADFTYLGSFRFPGSLNGGGDPMWGFGLAHRYVNGQLRFLTKAHGSPARIYEVAAPALIDDPSASRTAAVTRIWGDIPGADGVGTTLGLYWDQVDHKLFWSAGNMYNALSPYDPSVGAATLDDSTGTFTRHGRWGFSGRSCKMAMGGVLAIPRWFSELYCRGRRLGAGFGGYYSVATTGPISMGPALTAFDPADFPGTPNGGAVGHTVLVGYPFNAPAYTSPDRCHRDTDYDTEFDGWKVRNGIGYWSWTDYIWQGAVWVDTPTKTGLVYFPTMGNGRTWYQTSTLWAERASHAWIVYDPNDLALVAQNQKQQWQVQPAGYWLQKYPGITYPLGGWRDEPKQHVVGATFDSTTQTLYVAVRFALGFTSGSRVVVYAYGVA